MGTQLFSTDVYSRMAQEHDKLLRKAEELMQKILSSELPMRSICTISLNADGQFGLFKFIHTCVTDSYLMALYSCYKQHDSIALLFNSSEKLRAPMVFLRAGMYDEAKASWLFLSQFKVTKTSKKEPFYEIDAWSEPADHLHMFSDLFLPKDDSTPHNQEMIKNTLRAFKDLGIAHGLGFSSLTASLILVDIYQGIVPPPYVDDEYQRTFELQFLLMTRRSSSTHMIVGLNLFDKWTLFDDVGPSYEDFSFNYNFNEDFIICFAGYVNIKQKCFDLWLPKEYNELLRRAEELTRSILSRPNAWPMGSIYTIHLKAGGQFGPINFINTCVLDSFLVALYNCCIQNDHIKSLFDSFEKLRAPMVFLRAKKYNDAKASWLFWVQFNVTKDAFEKYKYVADAWSEPEDHLHVFNDLIVSNDKLSKFKHLGNVHALGIKDPELVLVVIHQGMYTAPPLYIKDDYYRAFELQFLLMSRTAFPTHMIVGLNLVDRWVCYDDVGPSYEDFNLKQADFKGDFSIHLAGYVRTHVPVGVAEEGYCGTVPFYPSCGFQKEHID